MFKYFSRLLVLISDGLFLNLAFIFVFWFRFKSGILQETYHPEKELAAYLIPMCILWFYWFVIFFFSGLYRNWTKESRLDQAWVVIKAITFGTAFLFFITSWEQIGEAIRSKDWSVAFTATKAVVIFQYWLSLFFLSVFNRVFVDTIFKKLLIKGIGADRVLIVGANDSGKELRENLAKFPALGHKVIGYIDDNGKRKGTEFDGHKIFGTYSEIPVICASNRIHAVIISKVSSSPNEINKIVKYCGEADIVVHIEPDLNDVIKGHLKTHQLYGFPLLVLLPDHLPEWEATLKRLLDIAVSAIALILGAPFWLLITVLVKLDSEGPAIYEQERVGQNGKPFVLKKFRTMRKDAEKNSGPVWAGAEDPRITKIGKFLRKTRLDEIPQFINVLKGDMSMVGPRPERAFFIEKLKEEIPIYVRRMKMKPGVTGWAQVKHHYDESIEDVKKKVIYDMYYFENMSIMMDLKILFLSVFVVLTGKGAH